MDRIRVPMHAVDHSASAHQSILPAERLDTGLGDLENEMVLTLAFDRNYTVAKLQRVYYVTS